MLKLTCAVKYNFTLAKELSSFSPLSFLVLLNSCQKLLCSLPCSYPLFQLMRITTRERANSFTDHSLSTKNERIKHYKIFNSNTNTTALITNVEATRSAHA